MSNRYYSKIYDEEWYIFDSEILSKSEFNEKKDYDGYSVFADSLSCNEILELLNEKEFYKKTVYNICAEVSDVFISVLGEDICETACRCDSIDEFVKKIRDAVDEVKKEIKEGEF